MTFTASEVRAYYAWRLPKMNLTNQREWRMPCPVHQGKDPNFAVNSESGLAQCHSRCGRGWDLISLEQELGGLDFIRAKEKVFEIVGRPKVPWQERNVTAIYDYTDADGRMVYQVLRYIDKEFKQRRPDGEGWVWGLSGVERIPFRLHRFKESEFVAVCEGEKDALTLERLGMVGTCNNGGAGNFKPELVKYFAGKTVGIFADNDDPGHGHAKKVAALLAPVAKAVKIVELPGVALKGDVTDYIATGKTIDDLRKLYRAAQPWTPEFEFSVNLPSEEEKYVRTWAQEIEEAGGDISFWDLARLSGLETPWTKLSRALGGGLRRGEIYVIGANQGAGKTSLALQFIIAAIRRLEACHMFSMEMGWRAVFQRMAAIESRVNLNDFREAQFAAKKKGITEDERVDAKRLRAEFLGLLLPTTEELSRLPLTVSTKPSVTPEYIAEEAARLGKRINLQLVVVDHMQLMSATGSVRGDYEKFTSISRAMKQTAVEMNLPVLLVSQTSRAQAKDHRGELEVSDLRGSGAIEEDAAGVMLLYEDKEDRERALADGDGSRYTRGPVKCYLKLGKNRYGEQGRCFELQHWKAITRFDPPEEQL